MAIEHRPDRRLAFRVYWINPHTGRKQSRSFEKRAQAERFNSHILHRLKYEPESFREADTTPAHYKALGRAGMPPASSTVPAGQP